MNIDLFPLENNVREYSESWISTLILLLCATREKSSSYLKSHIVMYRRFYTNFGALTSLVIILVMVALGAF